VADRLQLEFSVIELRDPDYMGPLIAGQVYDQLGVKLKDTHDLNAVAAQLRDRFDNIGRLRLAMSQFGVRILMGEIWILWKDHHDNQESAEA